jgi:hypothetical protein
MICNFGFSEIPGADPVLFASALAVWLKARHHD